MSTALLIVSVVLSLLVFFLAFLVLGALRALGVLTWRLDQMEAMRPSRIGREGLKVGRKAPNFTLPLVKPRPSVADDAAHARLSDYSGRKVLLVLTQSGCGPCMEIVPELNRLHERGEVHVLVVNNGDLEETRAWAAETQARFPVLAQEKFAISKRYEVFVTPFAFLIDEQGVITSKGIAGSREYLGYVISGAGNRPSHDAEQAPAEVSSEQPEKSGFQDPLSIKEPFHV